MASNCARFSFSQRRVGLDFRKCFFARKGGQAQELAAQRCVVEKHSGDASGA